MDELPPEKIIGLQRQILDWYRKHGRQLPWRITTDPYPIMVSEVMLQQTQADRVIPKYNNWLRLFPTVKDLAQASPAQVITAWAGLGYNRRALYLQRAAGAIVEHGNFPVSYDQLIKLPGLGQYTAAAILSFAFNQDIALVDTNIKRIYQLLIFGDQVEPKTKDLEDKAKIFLPLGHSRDWHNALMDIGSLISKTKGARDQQKQLLELFPLLRSFNLPTLSNQPLKRPKQGQFKESNRYWRGQILTILREQQTISIVELSATLGLSLLTTEQLITGLEKDRLVAWDKVMISLPQ